MKRMKILALGGCGDMGRMAVAILLDFPQKKYYNLRKSRLIWMISIR